MSETLKDNGKTNNNFDASIERKTPMPGHPYSDDPECDAGEPTEQASDELLEERRKAEEQIRKAREQADGIRNSARQVAEDYREKIMPADREGKRIDAYLAGIYCSGEIQTKAWNDLESASKSRKEFRNRIEAVSSRVAGEEFDQLRKQLDDIKEICDQFTLKTEKYIDEWHRSLYKTDPGSLLNMYSNWFVFTMLFVPKFLASDNEEKMKSDKKELCEQLAKLCSSFEKQLKVMYIDLEKE